MPLIAYLGVQGCSDPHARKSSSPLKRNQCGWRLFSNVYEFCGIFSAPSHCICFFSFFFWIPFHLGQPLQATSGVTRLLWRETDTISGKVNHISPARPPGACWGNTLVAHLQNSNCQSAQSDRSQLLCAVTQIKLGLWGDYCKMKTVMVYRLPTLGPFMGEHDGNDKRTIGFDSVSVFDQIYRPSRSRIVNECDSDANEQRCCGWLLLKTFRNN